MAAPTASSRRDGTGYGVTHEHEWERGIHMREAFGVDGRVAACAICGVTRSLRYRCVMVGCTIVGRHQHGDGVPKRIGGSYCMPVYALDLPA